LHPGHAGNLNAHRLPKLTQQERENLQRLLHLPVVGNRGSRIALRNVQGAQKGSVGVGNHDWLPSSASRIALTSACENTFCPQVARSWPAKSIVTGFGRAFATGNSRARSPAPTTRRPPLRPRA
jgi:hypothetical protein